MFPPVSRKEVTNFELCSTSPRSGASLILTRPMPATLKLPEFIKSWTAVSGFWQAENTRFAVEGMMSFVTHL